MTGLIVLGLYVAAFFGSYYLILWLVPKSFQLGGFAAQKTETFGDESAIRANRIASIVSVFVVFWLWVAFTNSTIPLPKMPGPFEGEVEFTYTATQPDGTSDDATVTVLVYREDIQLTVDDEGNPGQIPEAIQVESGDGFAKIFDDRTDLGDLFRVRCRLLPGADI